MRTSTVRGRARRRRRAASPRPPAAVARFPVDPRRCARSAGRPGRTPAASSAAMRASTRSRSAGGGACGGAACARSSTTARNAASSLAALGIAGRESRLEGARLVGWQCARGRRVRRVRGRYRCGACAVTVIRPRRRSGAACKGASCARSCVIAERMRVFTVPSGWSSRLRDLAVAETGEVGQLDDLAQLGVQRGERAVHESMPLGGGAEGLGTRPLAADLRRPRRAARSPGRGGAPGRRRPPGCASRSAARPAALPRDGS